MFLYFVSQRTFSDVGNRRPRNRFLRNSPKTNGSKNPKFAPSVKRRYYWGLCHVVWKSFGMSVFQHLKMCGEKRRKNCVRAHFLLALNLAYRRRFFSRHDQWQPVKQPTLQCLNRISIYLYSWSQGLHAELPLIPVSFKHLLWELTKLLPDCWNRVRRKRF